VLPSLTPASRLTFVMGVLPPEVSTVELLGPMQAQM